jgi:hypothetical protein
MKTVMQTAMMARLAAGAVTSAVLAIGFAPLAAAPASACTGCPPCGGGPPPAAHALAAGAPARTPERVGPDTPWAALAPADASTGQGSGKRTHNP